MKSKYANINIDESLIDTLVGDDVEFKGKINFTGSLLLNGKFEGEINASGHLIIGPDAVIKGILKSNIITSYGNIEGNLEGIEKVELRNKAKLTGDIKTPDLYIESGCSFNGKCAMTEIKIGIPKFATSSTPGKKSNPFTKSKS